MISRNHVAAFALCCLLGWLPTAQAESQPEADDVSIQVLSGKTMATKYVVKIVGEFPRQEVALEIDAELRRVNDQMSTYLKSSEISQFNASESTDWFPVSADTAKVVDFAQQVAKQTGGAFDVTVMPLVNAWSFGPDPRTHEVPATTRLEELRESVGFEKLQVRLDPPAIRKSIPQLTIDLSSIAKGHGVDRIVDLLASKGLNNVFVEIGGEVRTRGDKGGQPWKVGIQMPDVPDEASMIAHPTGQDESMATSGDYRNYFDADGQRFSHTIDPRTAKPIEHSLASVTIIAESCMAADAWATAINVLGPSDGYDVAKQADLSALLIVRSKDEFKLAGTGALAKYAQPVSVTVAAPATVQKLEQGNRWLPVMVLTMGLLGVLVCAMAIGVIFGRKPIAGSCGGLNNRQNEDGSVSCSLCSNPADACKELREKMQSSE